MQSRRLIIRAERDCRLESFELPEQPAGSQALIESIASVISAGTEIANYTGREPLTRQPGAWCYYPWVPGYGNIGRVMAVGPDARPDLRPGQLVFTFGPHAQHYLRNTAAGKDLVVALPETINVQRAVFARMASVATTALWHCEPYLRVGDPVAVVGLGLVGNLAAQLFQLGGAEVIGFDINARRREIAAACGIARTVDASGDLAARIKEATGGQGARFVIEATGLTDLAPLAIAGTATGGFCVLLGSPRQPLTPNGLQHLRDIHHRGLHLMGALEWVYPVHSPAGGRGIDVRIPWLVDLIEIGRIQVAPMWTHTVAPPEAPAAYAGLADTPDEYMGVVIDWTGG